MGPGVPVVLQIALLFSYIGYSALMFSAIRLHKDRKFVTDQVMLGVYIALGCGTISIAIRTIYFALL